MGAVKLGLGLELYRAKHLDVPLDLVTAADRLGFHSVWTAEAYGADALSPLAFFAAHTSRIKLATGVVQVSARTPAATAMHALTIDQLAGGDRVIIGLGVSGPQIVEGWYGQPWGSPNRRLRDYVSIMRQVVDREAPVEHRGAELSLPFDGPGAIGEGKALKSILHPAGRVEIWIASGGSRGRVRLVNPSTRREAIDLIVDLMLSSANERMLIGFDFSFGYPVGFAESVAGAGAGWSDVWAMLHERISDADDNANNRFEVAAELNGVLDGARPFWGHPGASAPVARRRPPSGRLAEFRLTEQRVIEDGHRPFSSWQLAYPGSVGSQMLL
ncbi:MAG: LLM class flavin-dependent oxidoreductase, partial [Actinobacteria bacterium]|nr:LLM class flavin-dependent oxidoreductase [Actinomycetota bacterium]